MTTDFPNAAQEAADRIKARRAEDGSLHGGGASVRVWPPAGWCAALNPDRTFMCDRAAGHEGDHSGPELPTVTLDES